jgi:hypothetical protein
VDILETGRSAADDAPFEPAYGFVRDIQAGPGAGADQSLRDLDGRYRQRLDQEPAQSPEPGPET